MGIQTPFPPLHKDIIFVIISNTLAKERLEKQVGTRDTAPNCQQCSHWLSIRWKNKPAVHMNLNDLFIKPQIYHECCIIHPPFLVLILKIQLPYFITYDKLLNELINHDCIIISALTSTLIHSTAVNFIWYVTTHCISFWWH